MVRWLIYSLLGLLLLSACAAPNALVSPEGARPVTEEEAFASPLSPLPEPEITSPLPESGLASPLSTPTAVLDTKAMATRLLPLLANRLGIEARTLSVVKVEAVTWGDTSLGCPQPGMMYAQVMTPGWRVTVEHAREGKRYDVHMAEKPESFVVCDGETEDAPQLPQRADEDNPAVAAARALIAQRQSFAPEGLELVALEAVEWADACLGCPEPETACAMVITPGYRIILKSGDVLYEVHTDLEGKSVVLCEGSEDVP